MLNKKFQLFSFALVSIILLACTFSSGAQWTVDITVTSVDPSVPSKNLTFGTDISVPKVPAPWPPRMGGSYLNAGFSDPTLPDTYYSTYTDENGPWVLRIQTNANFTIEWDSTDLAGIPDADGIYSMSKSLHDSGLPIDMGLLRSQTTLELPPGNYDLTTTKITATSKTLSISGTDAIVFDGTGVAIRFASGSGDVTVTRNAGVPPEVGEKVLPVHWEIQSDISGVTVTLIFYYDDAEVTAAGLNENTMMLGFNDSSGWQAALTQRDTIKNKLWTTTDHFSTWAIGEESSLPVILSSFVGYRDSNAGKVTLKWITNTEVNSLQWNIYRSEAKDGKYTRINSKGIPAAGNSDEQKSYKYIDATAIGRKTYYYYLEVVDVQGSTERFTIITVVPKFDLKTSLHTTWGKLKAGY